MRQRSGLYCIIGEAGENVQTTQPSTRTLQFAANSFYISSLSAPPCYLHISRDHSGALPKTQARTSLKDDPLLLHSPYSVVRAHLSWLHQQYRIATSSGMAH